MKPFLCSCGNRVFFENVQCLRCERELGFVPELGKLAALEPAADGSLRAQLEPETPRRKCQNYATENVCNWLCDAADENPLCRACQFSRVVPDLSIAENRVKWARLETAKRRLLFSLAELGLPVTPKSKDPERGLAFDFKADTENSVVLTGHDDGVVTLKLDEADPVLREQARVSLQERYRSLLGHFRHEVGHYYFDRLLVNTPALEEFRALFGDERRDYAEALKRHYARLPNDWSADFVSGYAQAHPWEDWAESFAHYLHMVDTLETAESYATSASETRLLAPSQRPLVERWLELTVVLNALNRSMGLEDAYPFQIGDGARRKIEFVQRVVTEHRRSALADGDVKAQRP
ncbi:MAG: zinc-binding metallopeptidase family protein [Myxococcota bacterium]